MFQKATKRAIKARVGLEGPTGAGKTWTALQWAAAFGQRIAVIDTERGSASLYSDRYDFDVLEMTPPYEPARLVAALEAAEKEGYDVVVIDSLSHFWEGEGGTLDMVDAAAQRSHGNSFAGWKVGTPALRHLIDTMLGLDAHLIVTMRSKMEYVLEEDDKGRKVPKKVGMAPVMRAGVEYEFQLVGDLDLEHRLTITKSRCETLADQVFAPGRSAEGARTFSQWLSTGEPMASRNDTDALVASMNDIVDDDERKKCKAAFVERFGRPAALAASKIEEARRFVAKWSNGPDEPDPEPASPPAATEETSGAGEETTPPADPAPVQPPEPALVAELDARLRALPTDLELDVRTQQSLALGGGRFEPHSEAHVAYVTKLIASNEEATKKRATKVAILCAKAGFEGDDDRHALLWAITNGHRDGRTNSAKRVSAEQLKDITKTCKQLERGELVAVYTDDGLTLRPAEGAMAS